MALAKLQIVFELDGVTHVVDGMQAVEASANRMDKTVTTATGKMVQSTDSVTTATGKMAAEHARHMSGVADNYHAAAQGATKLGEQVKHTHGDMTEFERQVQSVTMRIWNLTMALGMVMAPFLALGAVAKSSTDYLGQIETANLGIATSFMTGGKYIDQTTGKVLEGEAALKAAQADSVDVVKQLQVANLQTIATLDQLIKAYQETLPVAMSRGFNRDQVLQFTQAMVQAAGAIGLPFDQMGEETRSLLTGNINPRNSRIATVLGLRNEDIAQFENNAQGLFDFLMQKLDAYRVAGVESQKSWDGLWSNAKDIVSQGGGMAFEGLFESIKYELTEITKDFITIDEKTKTIRWNPDFLDGISSTRATITAITAEVYRFSMLLDKAGGSMTALGAISLKVAEVVTRFMTIGQFGDSLAKGSDKMKEWNKLYEERYKEAEKALQALADREAGLGKGVTSSGAKFVQNKPIKDAEEGMTASEYARLLSQAHEQYLQYSKAFDDRVLASLKNATNLQLAELEHRHNRGLVSEKDYIDQRLQLEKTGLDKELEQLNDRFSNISAAREKAEKQMLATATKQDGKTVYDANYLSAWMKAEKDYQDILKEREGLQAKSSQASLKATVDTWKYEEAVRSATDSQKIKLAEQTGALTEVVKLQIQQENHALELQGLYKGQTKAIKDQVDAIRLLKAQRDQENELLSATSKNKVDAASLNAATSRNGSSFGYGVIEAQLEAEKAAIAAKYELERQSIQTKIDLLQAGANAELDMIDQVHAARMAAIEAENKARYFDDPKRLAEAAAAQAEAEEAYSKKTEAIKIQSAKHTNLMIEALNQALTLSFKKQKQEELSAEQKATNSKLELTAQYAGIAGSFFTALAGTMDQSSRSGFESAKSMQLAGAIVSTAAAVMLQMSGGDPYTAWARAAAAAAMGAIQIYTIASTQYGGGASAPSVSSGSFSGGSGGGSGSVGSKIGAPITSIQDQQTQESMRNLATSMDNASLAIGRVADGLTKIEGLFESGQAKLAVGATPNLFADLYKSQGWSIGRDIKDMFSDVLGTNLPQRLLSDFFGWGSNWERMGAGISLGIRNGSTVGLNYEQWKKDGGWFGGDKNETRYSAMDAGFLGVMDRYVKQIESTINRSAVVMNTTADLPRVNVPFTNIATAGRSTEDIAKDLEAWLQKVGDEMAKNVQGLQDFAFYGENAYDALIRLSTSLQGVNEQLELVGATLLDSTLQGADAAYRLADSFGGLDKLTDAVGTYFDAMFTDSEKKSMTAAQAQRQMNVTFGEMGMAVPGTREQFRNLVNSLDLTTERGAAAFGALMNIAEAAGTVYDQAEEFAKNTRTMTNDLHTRLLRLDGQTAAADIYELMISQEDELQAARDKGLDVTQLMIVQQRELAKAVEDAGKTISDTQQQLIDAQRKLVETSKSALLDLIGTQETILNTIRTIQTGPLAMLSPEAAYQQTRAQFANSDLKSLSANATAFLEASKNYYASGSQYTADKQWVLSVLGNAAGIGDNPTLDMANAQLDVLKEIKTLIGTGNADQLAALQQQLSLTDTTNLEQLNLLKNQLQVMNNGNSEQMTLLKEQIGGSAGLTSLLTTYLQSNQAALEASQKAAEAAKAAAEAEIKALQEQAAREAAKADWQAGINTLTTTFNAQKSALHNDGVAPETYIKEAMQAVVSGKYIAKYDVYNEQAGRIGVDQKLTAADVLPFFQLWAPINNWAPSAYTNGGATSEGWNDFMERLMAPIWERLTSLPSFDVGTAGLAADTYALVHEDEKIIDPVASRYLSKYGIKVTGGGDGKVAAALVETNARLARVEQHLEAANRQRGAIGTKVIELNEKQAKSAEVSASKARLAASA